LLNANEVKFGRDCMCSEWKTYENKSTFYVSGLRTKIPSHGEPPPTAIRCERCVPATG
jgi:hypothetical protein